MSWCDDNGYRSEDGIVTLLSRTKGAWLACGLATPRPRDQTIFCSTVNGTSLEASLFNHKTSS
jgi:hypothetical protein